MKPKWTSVFLAVALILALAFGAGPAMAKGKAKAKGESDAAFWARIAVYDAKIAAIKARKPVPRLSQQAAQESAYVQEMKSLKAVTARATKVRMAVEARQDKYVAPLKMTIALPATTFAAGRKGLLTPTKSKPEYLGFPSLFRAGNAMKNHAAQTVLGGVADIATTPFSGTPTFAPVLGTVGVAGDRCIARGPVAQTLEMGASAVPAACLATGVTSAFIGTSYNVAMWITATTTPVAATAVGEAVDLAEKAVLK